MGLENRGEVLGAGRLSRPREPSGALDGGIPGRRPDAVVSRRPGGQAKHRLRERNTSAAHSALSVPRGLASTSPRGSPAGRPSRSLSRSNSSRWPHEADLLQRHLGALWRKERAHLPAARIRKALRTFASQSSAEVRQHVVGHVLLVADRRSAGTGPSSACTTSRQSVGCDATLVRTDGRSPVAPGRRHRTARRPPRCPGGSRRTASSRSRCCAGPTTSRCGRSPRHVDRALRRRPSARVKRSEARCVIRPGKGGRPMRPVDLAHGRDPAERARDEGLVAACARPT